MIDLKKTSTTKLDQFLSDDRDGVFYISHASILVRLSNKLFLFDPVLAKPPHFGSWLFFPEMILDRRLLDVDAVFVSHQHLDHCDTDFLGQLNEGTSVYILGGRPQFSQIFKDANIKVTELAANHIVRLPEGIDFLGIEHDYNKIDSSLVISNGNLTVYHGNDCFVSDEKLDLVKKHFPRVDVACVPFAYVHWYPFLLDEVDEAWKKSEADRLISKYLEYGLSQVRKLQPALAIPFGANMFYFDEVESDHNKAVLTPFDFEKYAHEMSFEFAESINPLFAGDFVYKNANRADQIVIHKAPFSLEKLKSNLGEFIEKVKRVGNGWDLRYLFDLPNTPRTELDFIGSRLEKFDAEMLEHNIYISNIECSDGYIEIDLKERRASFRTKIDQNRPFHHFKLTDLAFRAYISKEFSFNEIVASSMFRLARLPNDYNLPVLNIVNNVI